MKLGYIAAQLGLTVTQESMFKFYTSIFPYLRAQKESHTSQFKITSEYIFVRISEQTIAVKDNSFPFQEFQDQFMSPIFFKYSGDIRWNLYLILIVDKSIKGMNLLNIPEIETDDNYARKFVLTEEEAVDYLTRQWMKSGKVKAEERNIHNPVGGWIQHLEPSGLTGCLTNIYSTRQVDDFIEGSIISPTNALLDTEQPRHDRPENPADINNIQSVHLGNFRSHCLGENTIFPARVNLIYGSNGSGKTSLLEAIEYCLTNDIRRNKDFGISGNEQQRGMFIECDSNDQLISFSPGNSASYYKQLEEKWYGVPPGRNKSSINENFHRFNFFDTEAAYKFALQESGDKRSVQFDYEETLSRLIFGDQVVTMQKNWTRFSTAFSEKSSELNKLVQEAFEDIHSLEQQLTNIGEQSIGEDAKSEIEQLLSAIRYKDNSPFAVPDSLFKYVGALLSKLSSYREHVNLLVHANRISHPFVISKIASDRNILEINLEELDREIADVQSASSRATSRLLSMKERRTSLIRASRRLQHTRNRLKEAAQYKVVLENIGTIKERRELERTLTTVQSKISVVTRIIEEWPSLKNFMPHDFSTMSKEEHSRCELRLAELHERKSEAEKALSVVKQKISGLQALLATIRQLATEYLGQTETQTACPLCGHNHGEFHTLMNAIQHETRALEPTEAEYQNLEQYKYGIENEMAILQKALNDDKTKNNRVLRLKEVADRLCMVGFTGLGSEPSVEAALHFVQTAQSELSSLAALLQTSQDEIMHLESKGITLETISGAETFYKSDPTFRRLSQRKFSGREIYGRMQSICAAVEIGIKNTEDKISRITIDIAQFQDISNNQELNELESRKVNMQQRLSDIAELTSNIGILLVDFDIPIDVDLTEWCVKFRTLVSRLESLAIVVDKSNTLGSLRSQLEKKNDELVKLRSKLNRCDRAEKTLNSLRPLKVFVEEFIKENIVTIDRFFKLLHTPREFEQLHLNSKNLVAVRKKRNELVSPSQMSAGQRAAFALAVLFTLHLASDTVPKILLMDEPVANMDDLHLLNLLDVLRDIALMGHQIFFTTANTDVANLFRRKFSFFGSDFKQLTFLRSDDEPAQIVEYTFVPNEEQPTMTNVV